MVCYGTAALKITQSYGWAKRLVRGGSLILAFALGACANIDPFDKPYLHESFTGRAILVPSLEVYSQINTPTIVNLSGGGKEILITGLTGTEGLPIGFSREVDVLSAGLKTITRELRQRNISPEQDALLTALGQFMGEIGITRLQIQPKIPALIGRALSAKEIEIIGFPNLTPQTRELKPSVKGRLLLDGSRLYTPKGNLIQISVKTQALMLSFIQNLEVKTEKSGAQLQFEEDLAAHFGDDGQHHTVLPLSDFLRGQKTALGKEAKPLDSIRDISKNDAYNYAQDGGEVVVTAAPSDNDKNEPKDKTPNAQLLANIKDLIKKTFREDEDFPVWQIDFEGEIMTIL